MKQKVRDLMYYWTPLSGGMFYHTQSARTFVGAKLGKFKTGRFLIIA